ncbi:hypothetical protein M2158_007434 [Streptomyces sp. SAI-144]|jgi:hypothetical protein|uniref:hypothetical protein n=1 Tax=Streptomyces sp. SAI-144 TaxID=2940544 RepID=UPI002475DB0B|nr:hypothetical protein [Streptomyces sp. SAI-144]MDH6438893.1 hypothetical protein [Streptomyces sp. SAI-144]
MTRSVRPIPERRLRRPMGWNSWDCFGTTVTEGEVLVNATFMRDHMLPHGCDTVVVDIQWYEPTARAHGYNPDAPLPLDDHGRQLPAPDRFPSAADGTGLGPLADRVHQLGLRFGLHIMRGIPRRAVAARLPAAGTGWTADEIADTGSTRVSVVGRTPTLLPIGHIGIRAERGERGADGVSALSSPEQISLLTLWLLSRSPLMMGGRPAHQPAGDHRAAHQRRGARRPVAQQGQPRGPPREGPRPVDRPRTPTDVPATPPCPPLPTAPGRSPCRSAPSVPAAKTASGNCGPAPTRLTTTNACGPTSPHTAPPSTASHLRGRADAG